MLNGHPASGWILGRLSGVASSSTATLFCSCNTMPGPRARSMRSTTFRGPGALLADRERGERVAAAAPSTASRGSASGNFAVSPGGQNDLPPGSLTSVPPAEKSPPAASSGPRPPATWRPFRRDEMVLRTPFFGGRAPPPSLTAGNHLPPRRPLTESQPLFPTARFGRDELQNLPVS